MYPWYFEQDPALAPLRELAEVLAAAHRGLGTSVRRGAAGREHRARGRRRLHRRHLTWTGKSPWPPPAAVKGLQVWETAEFHHDGIADDGEGIFARLLAMVRG